MLDLRDELEIQFRFYIVHSDHLSCYQISQIGYIQNVYVDSIFILSLISSC